MLRFYGLDQRIWKRWETTAARCKEKLTGQQITVGDPGTILKDVETLIEFVGSEGIVTKGRNANLPIDRLPELNRRVSHPIQFAARFRACAFGWCVGGYSQALRTLAFS